jgi:acyl-CoA reductase-like NAD-dependent aldehyde dehydrogenase
MLMLIDGEWVGAESGATDEIRSPTDGSLIDTGPAGDAADADRAVAAAQAGKRRIAAMPAHERCAVLMRAADAIESNQEELSRLLARENGKTHRETGTEIGAAVRIFRGYAEEAKRIFGRAMPLDSVPGREASLAVTIRRPRGVVVAIVPFNYPAELWSHKAAGALAAGNAVITKPPEECPLTVMRIAEYMEAAGLPRAAHQVVTGTGETVGAALVRSDGVQMVAMTGSSETGRAILRSAADTMKKVHLELGGNDATIVCADADIADAASAVISGRFTSGNGQICCAVKRVLVEHAVVEKLTDALVAKTKSLKLGDPLAADTDVGPLITEKAAMRVEAQVNQAVADGAAVLAGGTRQGNFFAPTILTGVKPGMAAFSEEIFGPVIPIIPFADFEEALALANDSPYGLQAAIFTNDMGRIMRAFNELDVGTVVVNHSTAIRVENLPFGGNKLSGNAREGLHDTLIDMTEQRTLLLDDVFQAAG